MRRLVYFGLAATFPAATAMLTGCGRSNKTPDVAQDSILVKDADVAEHKTDTAGAATAALVRARGSAADLPALTTGAPVQRAPSNVGTANGSGLQPPARVYPSPVLPPRQAPPKPRPAPEADSQTSMQMSSPVTAPTPVTQPATPTPPVVAQPRILQPTPAPKPKKDSTDSLTVSR